MYACSRFIAPVAKSTLISSTKTYLQPLSSAVINHSQYLQQNQIQTPVSLLPIVRSFQTSTVSRDIDSAAKFIGAGAATVGVAGSACCIYSRQVELVPRAADPIRIACHQLLNLQFQNVILAVVPVVKVLRVKVLIVESEDLLVALMEVLA
ncbi:ATP synthase lipid-binding protein, mitochondrial [Cyphomyrmex costatus]|uniref:ATP synthase lipid-binding protein, mitochondrial n=1 Tax=Cyphomyrmex costatus TaxID=456900 RepID=A0A195CKA7_9HYME|nr:ATP synthase lipid-binding protein, mitochondrial [Cyphomyrmex costatus]